jgi:hypothetical protein
MKQQSTAKNRDVHVAKGIAISNLQDIFAKIFSSPISCFKLANVDNDEGWRFTSMTSYCYHLKTNTIT